MHVNILKKLTCMYRKADVGASMGTHSWFVSVYDDALLLMPLARQGVKGRIGVGKLPLNHNLPYGDDLHNATRDACPLSDPPGSMSCLHPFTSLAAFARKESAKDSRCTPDCSAILFIFDTK